MKNYLALALVLTVAGTAATMLFAQEKRMSPHGPAEMRAGAMGHMGGGMMAMHGAGHSAEAPWISLALHNQKELGLAEDQLRKLNVLRTNFQKTAIRSSGEIRIAELELRELLRAKSVDMSQVEAMVRKVASQRADLRIGRIKALQSGKAVLSAEQRAKLQSLVSEASSGMMHGRGTGQMPRHPAMTGMMAMARRMGNGDPMVGMGRMMDRMQRMEGTMGSGQMAESAGKAR